MAKKATVKKKQSSISAMTGPIGGPVPSAKLMGAQPVPTAMTGQIGPDLIGANIGKSQQIDAVEQAQMVDRMRKAALKKKLQGEVSLGPTTVQRYTEKPTGAPGEQAVDSVTKKPVKVKKKKA
jgi:hypothetical protein